MADTAARRRYDGETSVVAVKQIAREEPEAHPEHVEGDGRARGTTDRRVNGRSDHGGAIDGDGDFPMAAVDKMEQSTGHRASQEQGEARGALSKSKGSPESAGHDGASTTERLPATRKKGG